MIKNVIIWVLLLAALVFFLTRSTAITDYLEGRYIDRDPEAANAPKILYQLGNYCYFLSNNQRALACYNRVLQQYVESPWAPPSMYMIGKLYERQGDIANAKLTLNQLLQQFPRDEEWLEKAKQKLIELERISGELK